MQQTAERCQEQHLHEMLVALAGQNRVRQLPLREPPLALRVDGMWRPEGDAMAVAFLEETTAVLRKIQHLDGEALDEVRVWDLTPAMGTDEVRHARLEAGREQDMALACRVARFGLGLHQEVHAVRVTQQDARADACLLQHGLDPLPDLARACSDAGTHELEEPTVRPPEVAVELDAPPTFGIRFGSLGTDVHERNQLAGHRLGRAVRGEPFLPTF